MTQEILPGATLGVLGSGQLGRMFALAARRLGYGVQVYSPDAATPAGQIADREWVAEYDDLETLRNFARQVQVVTLEFENVSASALNHLEQFVPVRPNAPVLEAAQNRLQEKTTLRKIGLPTAEFQAVTSVEELTAALSRLGGRGVLKTASWGYDGKGQKSVRSSDDLSAVWQAFSATQAILEQFVDFRLELSVIAARNPQGEIRCYDPIINQHHDHILDVSTVPAIQLTVPQARQALEIATTVMQSLDVVGVLCVEMFLTQQGDLLINEIAPRPHNSGHLTIDAHLTSQFEQQVRAICGLPLGSAHLRQPAAMANLLGDLWESGQTPVWTRPLSRPGMMLHLYGKSEARPGRKMGHLTCLAENPEAAERQVRAARDELRRP